MKQNKNKTAQNTEGFEACCEWDSSTFWQLSEVLCVPGSWVGHELKKQENKNQMYEARQMTQTHFSEIYDPRTSKSVLWNFAMKMDSLNNDRAHSIAWV